MSPFNEYQVTNRQCVIGNGYVVTIASPVDIPIDTNCMIVQENGMVPIHKVEKETSSKNKVSLNHVWKIVTHTEIVGDTILIWNKSLTAVETEDKLNLSIKFDK